MSQPAFPQSNPQLTKEDPRWQGGGLSWADYAAIHITAAYVADLDIHAGIDAQKVAQSAYAVADALFAEKERREQP